MTHDFDQSIDRSGTHSVKFDARKAYFGRADVQPLWVADMDFATPGAVTEALIARAQHPVYGYTQYPDSMFQSMIDWCLRRFEWQITRNQIIMCPGVVPSIYAAIQALTEPGDKIIVQPPVYFPLFNAVTDTERELTLNPLRLEQGHYRMDLAHLEDCAKQGARMLLLCSPHNPVGRVWTREELSALLALAERYAMTIISDEIHADLIYPEQKHIPLASLTDSVNVLTTIAPSKTFNIPGLGLSSIIVPKAEDRKAIQRVTNQWQVSATNPFSITAFEAAYQHGEEWLEALMRYLDNTRARTEEFVDSELQHISVIHPEGTYLVWLDCREMGLENAALQQFFIHQAGVGLNPGYVFGEAGSGFMRLNIGTPWANVQQALTRIKSAQSVSNG